MAASVPSGRCLGVGEAFFGHYADRRSLQLAGSLTTTELDSGPGRGIGSWPVGLSRLAASRVASNPTGASEHDRVLLRG